MAVERPVKLVFNRIAEIDCVTASPASGHLTDDTTASYNLLSHYKTPRPTAVFFTTAAMFSAHTPHSDDEGEKLERLPERRRVDRRSTQFELLRGLQVGERHPNRPAPFSGRMQLQRKMFGKSSRYCVVRDGFLYIYRSKKEIDKGRIWRKIDLAQSIVSYRKADRILLINTDDKNELHRFKVSKDTFNEWLEYLRLHRLFRQDQFSGEQILGEPNTPRSPLTEYFPGIPSTRVDVTTLVDDVDSETSKKRVIEWLLESEKLDIREKECNEASMLVFELGSVIEQLEKCVDLASERPPVIDAESPKSPRRSLLGRLSFRRSRSHGRNDPEANQKTPTPARDKQAPELPPSMSTNIFVTGSSPDIRKLPKSPSASPVLKRMSREESDLFHRGTWLREEYLRLAKDAHNKFRTLLKVINAEQMKLRSLQQKWNDNYLDKPVDSAAAGSSSASSPVRRPEGGLYKNCDRSVSMNIRRDVLDPSRKSNDKTGSITDRQLERPSTVRTSSSVYYDAGEVPVNTGQLQPPSPPVSDVGGSSYTPSVIESDNGGEAKDDVENVESESTTSSLGEKEEDEDDDDEFLDAGDGGAKKMTKETSFLLPRYRERLPVFMPHAPSMFKLLYNAIGRDFTRFPLPVTTSEPLSLLQILCEELEYSELIDQAVASSDPHMRMVFVAAFAASRYGTTTFRMGRKPFNPLLCETFEFISPNLGWKYVSEQVSHHPAISACYAEGRGWRWWQAAEATVTFGGRSVEARPTTPVFLHLQRWNETYTWNKVTTYLTNLLSGPPFVIDHYGEMVIQCLENQVKCKVHFEKMHSSSSRGKISAKVVDARGDVMHSIFGKWTDSFYLTQSNSTSRCIWRLAALPTDYERFYGFTRFAMALNEMKPEVHGLLPPTDSRHRPDMRYLENGYTNEADKTKKKVEGDQRERLKKVREEDFPIWFKQSNKNPNVGAKWEFAGEYWKAKDSEFQGAQFLKIW